MTVADAIADFGRRAVVARVNDLLFDLNTLDLVCGNDPVRFRMRVRELVKSRRDEIQVKDGDYTDAWLLWQNDAVLGAFSTAATAAHAARLVRKRLGGKWFGKSPRWYQKEGPVARLEIDRRALRASLPTLVTTRELALSRLRG